MSSSPTFEIHRKESRRSVGSLERWAIILAGGEGTRLRSFTRSITGDERPKQFCPIFNGKTLLEQTRERVELSVSNEKALILLTASHEKYYRKLAHKNVTSRNLLVQPSNKGTAPAILYALLRVSKASPNAVVAFFPSDHYFSDDEKFMAYADAAFDVAERRADTVTLLGISPAAPETEFGWIEPTSTSFDNSLNTSPVRRFWEKPSIGLAKKLMESGSLWNSFVMIGRVEAFLKMIHRALPELSAHFEAIYPELGTPSEFDRLRELYSWLPEINFSHEVLSVRADDLSVMKVDDVGWNDLGEPSRVLETMSRKGLQIQMARTAG